MPCSVLILENDDAPRTIQRGNTYTYTEPFVADMLSFHDRSFLSNPNSTYDKEDCRGQMAVRALLRTVTHHFINQERRSGPYFLQLTDFHASNIFVDNNWKVTCLIDLDFVVALPLEALGVPYWFTDCGIDQIRGKELSHFDRVRREFMAILEEEELGMTAKLTPSRALVMHESWESRGVWFWHCLSSVDAMYSLVKNHICPKFSSLSTKKETVLAEFWCPGSAEVVEKKVDEFDKYQIDLRKLFHQTSSL